MNDMTTAANQDVDLPAVPTFDGKGYALSVFDTFKRQISRAKREAGKAETYDITTTAGMNRAKELRAMFRDIRTSVENTRKERKAPIIESGKLLDARAAELKAEVEPFEDKYDAEIKAEEKRKADEKTKKEAEERARVEAIEERLAHIRGIPGRMAGADSQSIAKEIDQWALLRLDPDDYQEYLEDALRAVTTTIDQLGELRTAAEAREAEQRRVIAEREELARLKAEQAERERVAAEEQAARDAAAKVERDAAAARERQAAAEKAALEQQLADMRAAMAAMQAATNPAPAPEPEPEAEPEKIVSMQLVEVPDENFGRAFMFKEAPPSENVEQPAPAAAPSEQEIVDVLVEHYGEPRVTVIGWLLNMDELLLKVAV